MDRAGSEVLPLTLMTQWKQLTRVWIQSPSAIDSAAALKTLQDFNAEIAGSHLDDMAVKRLHGALSFNLGE